MKFKVEYEYYTKDGVYIHMPIRYAVLVDDSSGFLRGVKAEVNSHRLFSLKKTYEYLERFWIMNRYNLDLPMCGITVLED